MIYSWLTEKEALPVFSYFLCHWLFFVHASAVKVPVEGSISILPQGFHPQAVCIQALEVAGVGI